MDKQSTEHNEEALVAMLASFRKEACYRDNFEEEFLHNFHLRKETDQATQSTWKLLLERLDNYLQNFRGWQWVYASMSIVTLAAVGVIIASGNINPSETSYASSNYDGNNALEKAQNVSEETTEIPTTAGMPVEKTTTFTTGEEAHEKSLQNNQPQAGSNTDSKPVSRVLIEM